MNPVYAQVSEVLRSMGKRADHLDDPLPATPLEIPVPSSLLEVDTNEMAKIAFPILKHMMLGQDSDESWSIERVLNEAMDNNLDNGAPFEKVCFAVIELIGGLHESGLIELPGGERVIRNETKFFLDCNSADAYEFLAAVAEGAGEDPMVVDGYRGDAEFIRKKS